MANYVLATDHDIFPPARYPLVSGAKDERAAREAYASVNTLLDYRASQFPDSPFLCPIDLDKGTCTEYTFAQTRRLVISFASALVAQLPLQTNGRQLVVGVCGRSGADYWVIDKAIQRLGHIPLHLSTTLSQSAAISLLQSNKPSHLIIGSDGDRVREAIPSELDHVVRLDWQTINGHLMCLDWSKDHTDSISSRVTVNLPPAILESQIQVILHSTGSTADPKPIRALNKCLLANPVRCRCDSRCLVTPIGHGYALLAALLALSGAKPIYVYPGAPYTLENIQMTIKIVSGRVENFCAVPMFIKLLSSVPDGLDSLKVFETVTMCGGQLSDQLMKELSDRGIKVWNCVQGSEVGHMLDSGEPKSTGWDWVEIPPGMEKYLVMETFDQDEGTYQLVIQKGYPPLFVFNRDGAYATRDLYVRHPEQPNKWKYSKRADDVIVHSIGLKTDPITMEHHLLASPHVKNVLVFGNDHPVAGALIIPSSPTVTSRDIQPLIDDLNQRLPSQSRLRAGLWKVLGPDDSFVISPKGTVIRKKTEDKWRTIIEGMYNDARDEVAQLQGAGR